MSLYQVPHQKQEANKDKNYLSAKALSNYRQTYLYEITISQIMEPQSACAKVIEIM